jgi:hypothetical protein
VVNILSLSPQQRIWLRSALYAENIQLRAMMKFFGMQDGLDKVREVEEKDPRSNRYLLLQVLRGIGMGGREVPDPLSFSSFAVAFPDFPVVPASFWLRKNLDSVHRSTAVLATCAERSMIGLGVRHRAETLNAGRHT